MTNTYEVWVSGRQHPISVVGDGYSTNSTSGELFIYAESGNGDHKKRTPVATFASNGWEAITVESKSAKEAPKAKVTFPTTFDSKPACESNHEQGFDD